MAQTLSVTEVARHFAEYINRVAYRLDWEFLRHGRRHDVWTDGERQEAIPRHTEINEKLARAILRRAKRNN